ncbi:hypothetical protein [Aeromicrobium sp. NPDC092404]|uniref:WXG100 family type VII secretion target n=1 Tax=Aeromicrobium sp. NPDC092404 TaxID=3154976 RepID=UPI00341E588D
MSEISLIVRHGSLEEMQTAMADAHETITTEIQAALDKVDAEVSGWSTATTSRIAQSDYQERLRSGVEKLAAALEDVRTALEDVAGKAHDAEVENVAIIG